MAISDKLITPLEIFYQWEEKYPNKLYLKQPIDGEWYTYTWKEVGEQVRRMAAALKAMNLPPKSHIAIMSKNCAHWIMTDLAIMMSGHISVPLYPTLDAKTLNYVLKHSEAKVLFVGKLDTWAGAKSGVPDDVHCITYPRYGEKGYENWDDIIAQHEPMQGNFSPKLDDRWTIIYTSGTTGTPKGVVHNVRSVAFAITGALEVINTGGLKGRFFSYLPLCHIAERMLVEMGSLYTGGEVHFAQSLDTFGANLQAASPTVFLGVPRIWAKFQQAILAKMPQKKLDTFLSIPLLSTFIRYKIQKTLGLGKVLHAFTGAAPTPPTLIKWYKKLGITIQEVYGMTENTAYSHYTRKDNIKLGSTGQPMPEVDVILSTKEENKGEILVKSHATMVKYYKEPEKTAATFQDGYLRTGDKGTIDENGFLKITGRVKEIFKTAKGKYVAPSPIEMRLAENAKIEQICLVGVNLPQTMALTVLGEEAQKMDRNEVAESLTASMNALNKVLAKHEKIKKIVILKEPWTVENGFLTPTMKIKRSPIEEKFQGNYQDWYNVSETIVWE